MNNKITIILLVLSFVFCNIGTYSVGRSYSDYYWKQSAIKENLVYYSIDKVTGEPILRWSNSDNPVYEIWPKLIEKD